MRFDRKTFFDGFRAKLDHTIEQDQVEAIEFLLASFETQPEWVDIRHIAYAFATIFHETAASMRPVEEGYYLARYGQKRVKDFQNGLRYAPYFGRGFVQLTWKTNYQKASTVLGVDLVGKPALALDPDIAFKVMTYGMFRGWFSKGNTLDKFIHGETCEYTHARHIINGTDKAAIIAGYAHTFESILRAALTSAVVSSEEAAAETSGDNEQTSIETPTPADGGASSSDEQSPTITVAAESKPSLWQRMSGWTEKINIVSGLKASLPEMPKISLSSWITFLWTKFWGWILMALGFLWTNPMLAGFGLVLVMVAIWYFSRSKDRATTRSAPTVNMQQKTVVQT